jgi:hypothetical protein
MAKPDEGNQKGAQAHAEGQQGAKTRARLEQQINDEGAREETHSQREANDPNRFGKRARTAAEPHEDDFPESDGRHRLFEGRQQHDEADKNSEKTRHARDVDRHDHGPDTELHHRDTQSRAKRKN